MDSEGYENEMCRNAVHSGNLVGINIHYTDQGLAHLTVISFQEETPINEDHMDSEGYENKMCRNAVHSGNLVGINIHYTTQIKI